MRIDGVTLPIFLFRTCATSVEELKPFVSPVVALFLLCQVFLIITHYPLGRFRDPSLSQNKFKKYHAEFLFQPNFWSKIDLLRFFGHPVCFEKCEELKKIIAMILNWGLVRLLAGIMLNFIQCFCNTIPQVTFEFNQFSKRNYGS